MNKEDESPKGRGSVHVPMWLVVIVAIFVTAMVLDKFNSEPLVYVDDLAQDSSAVKRTESRRTYMEGTLINLRSAYGKLLTENGTLYEENVKLRNKILRLEETK